MSLPACPVCHSGYTYEDSSLFICPECAHEWNAADASAVTQQSLIRDAHGNVLEDGDSITVIKDLKVKGSSLVIKVGTKAKNIRLLADAADGHDIDCKIEGMGSMKLKSAFVKKANS